MGGSNLTIVAPGTYVKGQIFSEDMLIVEGGVEGDIMGNRVVIKNQGWVHGNVTCRSLSIEKGGIVDGSLKVSATPTVPALEEKPTEALPPVEEPEDPEAEDMAAEEVAKEGNGLPIEIVEESPAPDEAAKPKDGA